MFEKFTDRARRIVVLAQEEARMLNHNYIGTEHILLGIIHEGDGVAAKALESLGIALEGVRQQVEEIIGQGQQASSGHIPFTPQGKKVLELSDRESKQLGHQYIGTEHILLGLIREGEVTGANGDLGVPILIKLGAEPSRVRQVVLQLLSGNPVKDQAQGRTSSLVLDQFGRNLTQSAREGKLDPVIGREKEIERVMQVLSRRTKNNPVLIGEPGVGKTAVVEGLAQGIVKGEVPERLKEKQLYTLDLGSLVAGSRNRAEVEERLTKVLKEIRTRGDIILFIDDVQAVDPPAAREAMVDLVTLLHAALLRGEARAVLVATAPAHDRAVTRDPSLTRVLQRVLVAAPSPATSIEILRAMRQRFEVHHHVVIADEALEAAVDLVAAHAGAQALPGRAVDLLDEAGARCQISQATLPPPPELAELATALAEVRADKEAKIDAQDFEAAAHARDREKQILRRRSELERSWRAGQHYPPAHVDEALVREVAADLFADSQIATGRPRTAPADWGEAVNLDLFRDEGSLWLIC